MVATLIKRYVCIDHASCKYPSWQATLKSPSPRAHLNKRPRYHFAMPLGSSRMLALTILVRLEAATSRLEDMVPVMGDSSTPLNGVQPNAGQDTTTTRSVSQLQENGSPAPQQLEILPLVIDDFDAIINGEIKTFVNMSEEIGGLVAEQVGYFDSSIIGLC